ncbi:DUF4190 domain-containing protein [Streptomyces sp. NPDC058613]|uniref:DUF4190 domain-containing protein n=1 Tax=Streptomyces sp. NPDC058613 TaxID=3346556 RepID=UPI00365E2E9A
MSTPPNPPSNPTGPPTEPDGTPIPEAASIPAPPARTLSFDKTPSPEQAPAAPGTPADATPADAPGAAAAPAPARDDAAAAPSAQDAPPAQDASGAAPAPADAPAFGPAPSAFAPPTPPAAPAPPPFGAAPGGPGAPAGPGGGNPWAQPGPGYGYGDGAGYVQSPPTANGMAVASLVLGIAGVLLGLVPLFFWVGGLLAATGLGLGIGALVRASNGAPRKTMSIIGTVLGVLGLGASVGGFFLTAYVVGRASDSIERSVEREQRELDELYPEDGAWPSQSASPSPSQVPGLDTALPFGESFTYEDGVKVSLSGLKKYKPETLYGQEKVKNAVQMTVTITNGSTKPHEVVYAVPNVRDDKGMTAKLLFDGTVPKMISGTILPGASASGIVAFEVPEGTKSVSADISAGTLLDDVQYTGPIG